MANLILTTYGWQQRIRDKLGVSSAYLPDSVLGQSDVITVAEGNIINQIPTYASLTDDPTGSPPTFDRTWLETAVICECAAIICPSMESRLPFRERGPHFSKDAPKNWEKMRIEMENERDRYIGKILDTGVYQMHFGLTKQ